MKQYVLTETIFKRLTKRNNGFLICNYCGKPIAPKQIVSKIHSENSNNSITVRVIQHQIVVAKESKNGTKRYHKECYEKTLH